MATPFFSNFCFESKIERTLVLGKKACMLKLDMEAHHEATLGLISMI